MVIILLSFVAAAFELFGMYLVGNKNKFGFKLNIVCCVLWMVVAAVSGVYGLMVTAIVMFMLNIRNFRKWRDEENRRNLRKVYEKLRG
jgi:nicotinamide riboside transporter PnuC